MQAHSGSGWQLIIIAYLRDKFMVKYRIRQNIRGGKLSRLDSKMVIRGKTFAVRNLLRSASAEIFSSARKLKWFDTCGQWVMAEEFETDISVRGYHVYQGNWTTYNLRAT